MGASRTSVFAEYIQPGGTGYKHRKRQLTCLAAIGLVVLGIRSGRREKGVPRSLFRNGYPITLTSEVGPAGAIGNVISIPI
jgi:hypothetical protein